MNPAKCDEHDYIHFIIAAQRAFSCTEAARCQPDEADAPSHDAFTRLLTRQPPDTEALCRETRGLLRRKAGVLVLDDSTLDKPYARGFAPERVLFDSWHSSLENLKQVRAYGWSWLTRLKSNRQVYPDGSGNVAVGSIEISAEGRRVHLRGYGFIKVFRTVSGNGDAQYWATDDLPDVCERTRRVGQERVDYRELPSRRQAMLWRREGAGQVCQGSE